PSTRFGLADVRYAAEAGVFAKPLAVWSSSPSRTQAPSSRSNASGSAASSLASAAVGFGPAARASNTPRETAANNTFDLRKALSRSRTGAGSGGVRSRATAHLRAGIVSVAG